MPNHDSLPQRDGTRLLESETRASILLVDDDARGLFAQQAGGAAVIDSGAKGTRVTLYLPRAPAASLGLRGALGDPALGAT